MVRELKIGTSWVRGVVGEALTPELVVDFSCAFGTWASGGPVVIGRDTRRSSPMLHAAVVAGLMSPGCEIIDLGVAPTPLVAFAVRELGATGGLAITGSHNDAPWNALKFIGPEGTLLNTVKSEELLDIYHAAAFLRAPAERLGAVTAAPEIADRYIEHLVAHLDVEPIRARGFRVAVDFCNGSCAELAARFLATLGCALLPLNEDPADQFAHPPSPCPANMRALVGLLGYLDTDLGAAMNVDGDRIAFATPAGTALSEECTLPLAAGGRLARRPGAVVTNLSSSRMVDAVAARHGQQVLRAVVGEGHVVDRGLSEDAALAGEGNGGVAVLPATTTFDALLTLGIVLEALALNDTTLAEMAAELPRLIMRKGEMSCPPDHVYRVLEEFRGAFAGDEPDLTDGVRVDWPDAWLHVRASNTEPILRLIVEAETEKRAQELFEAAEARARRTVRWRREL